METCSGGWRRNAGRALDGVVGAQDLVKGWAIAWDLAMYKVNKTCCTA